MTLEFKIDTTAITKAMRALDGFDKVAKQEIEHATQDNIQWGHDFLGKYPPKPHGSTYVRTGTLGRRWQHTVNEFSGGIRAILSNPTEYMPYVQDEVMQAKVHRGRWPTIQMLTRVPVYKFRQRYEQALRRIGDIMAGRFRG